MEEAETHIVAEELCCPTKTEEISLLGSAETLVLNKLWELRDKWAQWHEWKIRQRDGKRRLGKEPPKLSLADGYFALRSYKTFHEADLANGDPEPTKCLELKNVTHQEMATYWPNRIPPPPSVKKA